MADRASWPAHLRTDAYSQSPTPQRPDDTSRQPQPHRHQHCVGPLAELSDRRQAEQHTVADAHDAGTSARFARVGTAPPQLWSSPVWGGLIKRGPYTGHPRPYLTQNGDFSVPPYPGREDTGGPVDCGPLAMGYLMVPHFIDTVVNSGRIAEVFGGEQHLRSKALDAIRAIRQQPEATRQLLTNHGLGAYLSDMKDAMLQVGLADARILMSTGPHLMAIRMSIKRRAGRDMVLVRAYDPNITGWHRKERIDIADSTGQLRQLSMSKLFPCPPQYFDHDIALDRQCFSAISLDGVQLAPPNALLYMGGPAAVVQSSVLERSDIVHRGALDNIPTVLSQLIAPHEVNTSNGFAIMRGVNRLGEPAVRTAYDNGNITFLPMYAHALRQHGFSSQAAGALIEGRDGDDIPLLFAAAAEDEGALPVAYAEALAIAGITGRDAIPYMMAANPDGVPALLYAVEQGHTTYAKAYGQALQRLSISIDDAFMLLDARDAQGRPALLDAYENDDPAMIYAYHEVMQALGFPPRAQHTIFHAETEASTGPDVARSEGCYEALAAYEDVMQRIG